MLPSSSSTSPVCTSSPRCRTCWSRSGAWVIRTEAMPPSVHSTGTIASEPCGTGAPVMIRTAVPGESAMCLVCPAAISPTTGRCTGWSSEAETTSS